MPRKHDRKPRVSRIFRRDYEAIYAALHPTLRVIEEGFLDRDAGFDRATWQLLQRG